MGLRGVAAGWSFLAGVFVFVHVGFNQVGYFTGVHLAALTVTNLMRKKQIWLDLISLLLDFDSGEPSSANPPTAELASHLVDQIFCKYK